MTPLPLTNLPKAIYIPSKECLRILNEQTWVASYSGGKDSTSVVTWIEWLRRIGWVKVQTPRLVLSDTEVEFPFLQETTNGLLEVMRKSGWDCTVVRPEVSDKLYNSIFGRGLPPISPALKGRRWCTTATKIKPMMKHSESVSGDVVKITGVRWGESDRRDGRLKASGCSAGGECGLPVPKKGDGHEEGLYAPIVNWRTCQVVEWLGGVVSGMDDVWEVTKKLLDTYEVRTEHGFEFFPPKITTRRFGCIGCPAWNDARVTPQQMRRMPSLAAIDRIYGIWAMARLPENRLFKFKDKRKIRGPIKMEVRKRLFARFMEIQAKCGLVLVTPEDEQFIRECWERKVYPRGWSAEDEVRCAEPIKDFFEE